MTIKVVRGNPTPEELAAALTVIHARAARASSVPAVSKRPGEWADKRRNMPRRAFAQPGQASWRSSYWPR